MGQGSALQIVRKALKASFELTSLKTTLLRRQLEQERDVAFLQHLVQLARPDHSSPRHRRPQHRNRSKPSTNLVEKTQKSSTS